jgi:glycosyltransferase involved in cell wall biosynthesis
VPTSKEPRLPHNLWIDVEDLFDHVVSNPRPSGLHRLSYEVSRALQQQHCLSGRIRFVRHDPVRNTFRIVPWPTVVHMFERLADAPLADRRNRTGATTRGHTDAVAAEPRWRRQARRVVYRLPSGLRQRLLTTARQQWQAGAALADLLVFCAGGAVAAARGWAGRSVAARIGWRAPEPVADFANLVRVGDFLISLGASWRYPDYAGLIGETRRRFGVRFALLVFDIIPLRHAEWFDRELTRTFRDWFTSVLPAADVILAISRATAGDVERFATESGIALRSPIQTIPIGTGFGAMPRAPAITSNHLPPAGSYVLFVSTIEARKNHQLLFRVWRRMLDEMPAARVPTLVFAGRVGWLVEDLMKQLTNTNYLDRKIQLIDDASDAELANLYRGCLFTLFPSLYEGWGLPVTESLMFGKPCIVARGTSIQEAGGRLARYFDPDCVSDAYGVIRAVVEDHEGLRAWQAEIVRCFAPVPWTATGDAILQRLGIG